MVACVPKLVSSTWNQYAHRHGSSEARRRSHNRAQRPAGAMGRSRLGRTLNSLISQSRRYPFSKSSQPRKTLLGFRPLCTIATADTATSTPVPWKNPFVEVEEKRRQEKHSILLEKLRTREARDAEPTKRKPEHSTERQSEDDSRELKKSPASFEELGLSGEVMEAVRKINISVPTEIQRIAIPAVLEQQNLVLGSHTGSGKTLAYMLPLVQLLRQDEALRGRLMKPRNPRAIVLCPTRELSEQVCRVAKSICHHARFRCLMVGGGSRIRFQKDALNEPIDMVVGTPGRVLEHIEGRTLSYSGLKYLVLDEADTMFDRGFGPDIQRFIHPLKCRASQSEDKGYQAVLVAATITKPVQKLIDKEFQGITHLRTSTMHKTVASARHAFIKLSGSQDKLEVLLQVLEPILSKKQQVMVFCNTLDSSRAVDHFLVENNIYSANYHGAVPAKQRVENLNKFKDETVECHTLVCSDLAARGLDLHVDHVIMFDFPLNSIDYLHRTGRTARMGAKGKVTSLVTKRDLRLANKIEEAITKNTSLESISVDEMQQEYLRSQITQETKRDAKLVRSETEKKLKADEDQPRAKPQPEKPRRAKILPWLSAKSTPRSSHQRVAAPDGAQRRISARRPSAQETRARLGIAGLRKLSSLPSHCE